MGWEPESFEGLPYRVLLPDTYAPQSRRYPVVLFLHGSAERGTDNLAQLKNGVGAFASLQFRAQHPCIVVAPQAPPGGSFGGQWYPGQHATQDAVLGLMAQLAARRSVDASQLFIVGISMGAIGGWELLVRAPERFAAAVLICGEPDPRWVSAVRTPVWGFHGAADPFVPPGPANLLCAALRARGAEARFTLYEDAGHDVWDRALAEPALAPWLFAQRR